MADHHICASATPWRNRGDDDVKEPLLGHSQCHDVRGVTFVKTCFTATNALSGIGVLSMPYALSQGGWLSFVLFFVVVVICYYTGLLLQQCVDVDPCITTYPDIGGFAFGYKGRLLISASMFLELYLVGVSLLILEGDNMEKLFPDEYFKVASLSIGGRQLFVIMSMLIILPTTLSRNLAMLAYFSVVGVFASVIMLVSLLWASIADIGLIQGKETSLNVSGLATSLGLYFVCFSSHAVFPTIYASMKDQTRFPKVLQISFLLCTLNYGLVAVLGYLMFGEEVQSQVTLNLPAGKLYSKIAIYATLITPFAKYALMVNPISMAIEERWSLYGRMSSILVRTLLFISTLVIALTVPFFGYVMTFIGSFLCIIISVLMPCICYLKIFKSSRKFWIELVGIVIILVIGGVVSVVGTYSSLREIVNSM